MTTDKLAVYLETGKSKTVAGALDWPGWCRIGRDEASSLEALVAYASRYAKLFAHTKIAFTPPADADAFDVVERLKGINATDWGAPVVAPRHDAEPFDDAEHARSETILAAIWRAFDRAFEAAEGHELRKGPRGGGRERDTIARHVLGADVGYLAKVGQTFRANDDAPIPEELDRTREAIRQALAAGARGEIPTIGRRGGALWTPRYYVRRLAWHTLDHAWEIEDRIV